MADREEETSRFGMPPRNRSARTARILAIVPGWGHIYWGREATGLAIFTAAVLSVFFLINSRLLYLDVARSQLTWTASLLCAVIFLGSWLDMFRRTRPTRVRALEEERATCLRRGIILFLKGQLAAAEVEFRACLREDPCDVEALFRLGVTCCRSGDAKRGRQWLRRARKYDVEEKWRWEIDRELGRARSDRAAPRVDSASAPDLASGAESATDARQDRGEEKVADLAEAGVSRTSETERTERTERTSQESAASS